MKIKLPNTTGYKIQCEKCVDYAFTVYNNMFTLFMTLLLINNGYSDINKYPYVVGIGYTEAKKDIHVCTGTLLQENWVITAGDCIEQHRSYFVVITNNKDGKDVHTTVRTVLGRYVKDHFDFNAEDSSFLGLIKIDHVASIIKTYPTLPQKPLPPKDLRFVYVEYVAGLEDKSKNNKAKVVNFGSSWCEPMYVCVNDARHVLSTKYGGPLFYNGSIIVGVFSRDIVDGNIKRFIALNHYFDWINQHMGRKLTG